MAMEKLGNILRKESTSKVNKRYETMGIHKYHLYKETNATLGAQLDLKTLVKLPPDEDFDDFLATHIVDFYNRSKLLYSTIHDNSPLHKTPPCTEESCPTMSGGPKYEYFWQDEERYKKPTALNAPEYIFTLIEWVDDIINNENIFPPEDDIPFPKNFKKTGIKMVRRLYRIFVHIYIHHFDRIKEIGADAHTNTFYKHFYYFVKEHQLMEDKDFLPLQELTQRICT